GASLRPSNAINTVNLIGNVVALVIKLHEVNLKGTSAAIRCENEKSELRWIVQARCIALLVLREEVVTDELRCRDDREAARDANANKCRMSVLSGCPLLDADQECLLGIRLEVDV